MTAPGYQPVPAPPGHDWSRYDLDQIWAMVSTHSDASADIASDMWRRIGELCYVESSQIEQALTKLNEAWPLTQPASILFNAWAQKLIAAMRGTAANSIGNQLALIETTGWISTARKRILELRFQASDYRQMMDQAAQTDPWGVAGAPDSRPHPPAGWYEDLSQQAREIIAEMESRVFHSAMRGEIDRPFDGDPPSWVPTESGGTELGGSSGGFIVGNMAFADLPQPTWPEDLNPDDRYIDDPVLDHRTGGARVDPITGASFAGGSPYGDTPIGRLPPSGGLPAGSNPAGGAVIAGSATTGAVGTGAAGTPSRGPTGSGMVPFMPPIGPPVGRAAGDSQGAVAAPRSGRRTGLRSAFETPTALDGVLRPVPETRPEDFDPGPGVIGIDR